MSFTSRLLCWVCLAAVLVTAVLVCTAVFAPKLLVAVAVALVVLAAANAPRAMRRLGERSRRSMHYRP